MMGIPQEQGPVVSAQVLLQPQSGAKIDGRTSITAENIARYLPSAETVASATQAFADAGFEVSHAVGNNFSITAPLAIFERVFHTRLRLDPNGGVEVLQSHKDRREETRDKYRLPLVKLPPPLAHHVEAVTFSPPPDFGPM